MAHSDSACFHPLDKSHHLIGTIKETDCRCRVSEMVWSGRVAVSARLGDVGAHGTVSFSSESVEYPLDAMAEAAFGSIVVSSGGVASGVLSVYDPRASLSLDWSMLREATEWWSVVVVTGDPRTVSHNFLLKGWLDHSVWVACTSSVNGKVFGMARGTAWNTGWEG